MTATPQYFDPMLDANEADQDKWRRGVIAHLADNGQPVCEDVRIYRLAYNLRGEHIVATVGEMHERPGGDFVEFIFQSADRPGLYYVTGPGSGVLKGGPAMVGADMSPRPVPFSEK